MKKDEARLTARFFRRYKALFGKDFPRKREDVEREVGRLLATLPGPTGLVAELLDLLVEEASRRHAPLADLSVVAEAARGRRVLLQGLVERAISGDARLAHRWLAELPVRAPADLTNTVLLARYKLELKANLDRRPRTIQSYLTSAEAFARHLQERKASVLEATPDDIRSFKARLLSAKKAPATVNLRLAGVKALYRLLVREKLAGHELLEAFVGVPIGKRIRTLLAAQEVERLVVAIDETTILGMRDAAFLRLLFGTAARVGELLHLSLPEVDLAAGQIILSARKNRDDHLAVLPEVAARSLARYLDQARPKLAARAPAGSPASGLVFLSKSGGPFHRSTVTSRLASYARAAGITKRVTSHVFRRSVATILAEAGMPAELVRVFLGHRNLATTLGTYVVYSRETLRANLGRFHPWFGAQGGGSPIMT